MVLGLGDVPCRNARNKKIDAKQHVTDKNKQHREQPNKDSRSIVSGISGSRGRISLFIVVVHGSLLFVLCVAFN